MSDDDEFNLFLKLPEGEQTWEEVIPKDKVFTVTLDVSFRGEEIRTSGQFSIKLARLFSPHVFFNDIKVTRPSAYFRYQVVLDTENMIKLVNNKNYGIFKNDYNITVMSYKVNLTEDGKVAEEECTPMRRVEQMKMRDGAENELVITMRRGGSPADAPARGMMTFNLLSDRKEVTRILEHFNLIGHVKRVSKATPSIPTLAISLHTSVEDLQDQITVEPMMVYDPTFQSGNSELWAHIKIDRNQQVRRLTIEGIAGRADLLEAKHRLAYHGSLMSELTPVIWTNDVDEAMCGVENGDITVSVDLKYELNFLILGRTAFKVSYQGQAIQCSYCFSWLHVGRECFRRDERRDDLLRSYHEKWKKQMNYKRLDEGDDLEDSLIEPKNIDLGKVGQVEDSSQSSDDGTTSEEDDDSTTGEESSEDEQEDQEEQEEGEGPVTTSTKETKKKNARGDEVGLTGHDVNGEQEVGGGPDTKDEMTKKEKKAKKKRERTEKKKEDLKKKASEEEEVKREEERKLEQEKAEGEARKKKEEEEADEKKKVEAEEAAKKKKEEEEKEEKRKVEEDAKKKKEKKEKEDKEKVDEDEMARKKINQVKDDGSKDDVDGRTSTVSKGATTVSTIRFNEEFTSEAAKIKRDLTKQGDIVNKDLLDLNKGKRVTMALKNEKDILKKKGSKEGEEEVKKVDMKAEDDKLDVQAEAEGEVKDLDAVVEKEDPVVEKEDPKDDKTQKRKADDVLSPLTNDAKVTGSGRRKEAAKDKFLKDCQGYSKRITSRTTGKEKAKIRKELEDNFSKTATLLKNETNLKECKTEYDKMLKKLGLKTVTNVDESVKSEKKHGSE